MGRIPTEDIRKILENAEKRLGENIEFDKEEHFEGDSFSREYKVFRRENLENYVSKYEKACNFCKNLLKIKVKDKDRKKLEDAIDTAHLDITPEAANSFAAVVVSIVVLLSIIFGVLSYYLNGTPGFFSPAGGIKEVSFAIFMIPLILIGLAALFMKPLSQYPTRIANRWRLRVTNQMVLCVLYMVMYMRHTSNLEHAIKFAGEHLGAPLSLDLRKVLWDVEMGRFVTIRESLDSYLLGWRDHSLEFVEAMHLIEGSLYESDDTRRTAMLEKALEVILNGTYEKMLHYAQDLRSPMTMIYMMGVILPVLGLVIFPLMSGFLGGVVKWWHLGILYNIFLPVFVYFYGMQLLDKRPTGYGGEDILQLHPEFGAFTKVNLLGKQTNPMIFSVIIVIVFTIIGLIPLFLYYFTTGDPEFMGVPLLDYKCTAAGCLGPYGIGSMVLSLFFPLGIALAIGSYFYFWSKKLIKIGQNTSKMEKEFSGAIFQLGNRVGQGLPVEHTFRSVAEDMKGTPSGDFLRIVDTNIRKLGMSVKEAIFNRERGALVYFPSNLIKTSMKVLIESSKKGPAVVAKSLLTISDYVHRVNAISERLKDLLAEILSSMKSQITFLTPMIAGIVVGVTSMMISIINFLSQALVEYGGEGAATEGTLGNVGAILSILNITDIIPGYQFQMVVGLFVIEVTIILTIFSSGIENGIDTVSQRYKMAKNLFISVGLYFVITLISILIFNVLARGVADIAAAPV